MTLGVYALKVTVTMTAAAVAGVVVSSTADVGLPSRARPPVRPRSAPRIVKKIARAVVKRTR